MDELAEIRAELAALRASNDDLREQLDELNQVRVDAPVSRRRLLSKAAAVAVGAVAGGAALSRPAFAAVTDVLQGGEINRAFNQTTIMYGNTVGHGPVGTELTTADVLLVVDNSGSPRLSAVGLQVLGRRTGIVAQSSATGGVGIEARGLGIGSTGLFASGTNVAINASSTDVAINASGDSAGIITQGARPLAFEGGHGAAGPPTDASSNGSFAQDIDNNIYYCVAGGTPGTYRKLAGPGTAGALHLLPTSVRAYDSRVLGDAVGVLRPGVPITVNCSFGSAGVPTDATAVVCNLTVTQTEAAGYITAWGPGPQPPTSAINWSGPALTVANGSTLACDVGATLHFVAGGGGGTHLIVDISGYYR